VAEVDGNIHAAISLSDGRAIADPFRHTAELVDLLKMRAAQLTQPAEPRTTGRHILPRRVTARA
jgi:hypothetical protein